MTALITEPNLADFDAVYQALIDLHTGLTPEESARVNARLILTLCNHIGDEAAIFEALSLAGRADRA